MAHIAARLIYATMGIVADHLLGNGHPEQAQALLCRLFELRHNVFSYQLADALILEDEPVGVLVSTSWRAMRRLHLPTALQIARTGGIRTLLRLLVRSAPFARAEEAEDDEYFIAHIALLPGFRSRGLGALLIRHAEAKARQAGCIGLALTVASDNPRAISFYRRLEFEMVGTTRFPALEQTMGYSSFHRMRKSLI